MTRALSIHIGLNRVDPSSYGGWAGELHACEADAHSMRDIASTLGYETETLLTRDATAGAVIAAIQRAATRLSSGDICLITNSSHGGQVADTNGDEPDGRDETWAMYDRQIVDDELYTLWATFDSGVRIVVVSDSCHSGTVTRAALIADTEWEPPPLADGSFPGVRGIPWEVAQRDARERADLYRQVQDAVPSSDKIDVEASVLLMSGCQDNQVSLDGERNGLFTAKLLEVWDGGAFQGSYRQLTTQILARMPPSQSPRLFPTGRRDDAFMKSRPFTP